MSETVRVKTSDMVSSIAMVAKRQAEYEMVCAERDALKAEVGGLRELCRAAHNGMDLLLAKIIMIDPHFMPTASPVWETICALHKAIQPPHDPLSIEARHNDEWAGMTERERAQAEGDGDE